MAKLLYTIPESDILEAVIKRIASEPSEGLSELDIEDFIDNDE